MRVARRRTTANERSFNNEQGLPVTILNAPDDTEVLVLEMGMRGFGEISRLCEVARPDIGVVTAVGHSHTERVGGIDGVAIGQGRTRRSAARSRARRCSTPTTSGWRRWPARPGRRCSRSADAATCASATSSSTTLARAALHDRHAVGECAGAAGGAAARTWRPTPRRRSPSPASSASPSTRPSTRSATPRCRRCGWRSPLLRVGATMINDAYNANPTSMRAALEALAAMRADGVSPCSV